MADPKAEAAGRPEPGGSGGSAASAGTAGTAGEVAEQMGQDGAESDLLHPRAPADDRWFDDEAGPVVRLYSMTRAAPGRSRTACST